jgi:hypothetical protein
MLSEKQLDDLQREMTSNVGSSYLASKVPMLIKEIHLLRKVAKAARSVVVADVVELPAAIGVLDLAVLQLEEWEES